MVFEHEINEVTDEVIWDLKNRGQKMLAAV